ncbi:hypothetical protein GGS24DRAFT_450605 [Hypoxylon argillaceum]|nr:hypothetical protein GGS24DRAFT_450605 [Hypoxylon argillaceum]
MPPVQNTFSIVPDVVSGLNGNLDSYTGGANARTSRPPMTSKQVKKAYQKANKGPKISKAEQRRIELFEQDRIRKEFEKEKSQARARAARDKKKEKEEKQRAERKKKGLPLVDARPSQDTIARFARAKPKSRKDDSISLLSGSERDNRSLSPTHPRHNSKNSDQIPEFDESDKENEKIEKEPPPLQPVLVDSSHGIGCKSPSLCDDAEPPSKKRKVNVPEEKDEDVPLFPITSEGVSLSPEPDSKVDVISEHAKENTTPSLERERVELNVDDSFSTIDLNEEDLFDDLFQEIEGRPSSLNAPETTISGQRQDKSPPTKPPLYKPPEDYVRSPNKIERPLSCSNQAVRPTEPSSSPYMAVLLPKPVPGTVNTPRQNPLPEQAKRVLTPPLAVPPTSSVRKSQPTFLGLDPCRNSRTAMAPPTVPPKFKFSKQVSAGSPRTPQFLKPPLPLPRTPATGPGNSRISKPKQVPETTLPPSTQLFVLNHLDDFFPSPSQEVREIFDEPRRKYARDESKASKPKPNIPKTLATPYNRRVISTAGIDPRGPRHIQQISSRPEPEKVIVQPSIQPIPQNTSSICDMPFFSTQDLLLSSQDLKDIEEDPLPTPKAQPPKDDVKPRDAPRRSPKQLFTSTCRELRYKCAIERHRTAQWEGPSARQKAREELDRIQALEDEQLEALLANPDEEWGEKNEDIVVSNGSCTTKLDATRSGSPTMRLHNTSTPPARPPGLVRPDRSARSSAPMPEDTALDSRKQPDAQASRPKVESGSGGTCQRNGRPKGSYEAMLELLAKGPKQKPGARVEKNADINIGDKNGKSHYRAGHADQRDQTPEEFHAMMTVIPGSQETDYGFGEEWDDDDLLCGMV